MSARRADADRSLRRFVRVVEEFGTVAQMKTRAGIGRSHRHRGFLGPAQGNFPNRSFWPRAASARWTGRFGRTILCPWVAMRLNGSTEDCEMGKGFDGAGFVKDIGILLVHAYDGARRATTPGLVGSAIENPVRSLLATVLPSGLSVGTGCVVDSYGTASRQMDIVLHERDICPVYRVNDTPEATYFPCEGVVAVGEIKATIDGPKLEDSFEKIESVKTLRRHWEEFQPTVRGEKRFRSYGIAANVVGVRSANENEERERDEVFGFVLAGTSRLKPETLVQRYENRARENGAGFVSERASDHGRRIRASVRLGWKRTGNSETVIPHRRSSWVLRGCGELQSSD